MAYTKGTRIRRLDKQRFHKMLYRNPNIEEHPPCQKPE